MNKKLAISALFLIILGTCTARAQSDWRTPVAKSLNNVPKLENLRLDVTFLSDSLRQGRGRGSAGHSDAALYIQQRLEQAGCKPLSGSWCQCFAVNSITDMGHNIIGMLDCSGNPGCDSYIIVGAHYDGLGTINGIVYPGADANASGVAAMIENAFAFSRQLETGFRYSSKIIFAAFDSYMDGRKGAGHFYDSLVRGELIDPLSHKPILPEQIKLMVDIDQIGSSTAQLHKDRPDYLLAIGESSFTSANARKVLNRCNSFYGIGLDLGKSYYNSERFTEMFYTLGDRKHFIAGGIPTIYFTSGITDSTNKAGDNAQSLDYEVLQKRTLLIFRFLEKYF